MSFYVNLLLCLHRNCMLMFNKVWLKCSIYHKIQWNILATNVFTLYIKGIVVGMVAGAHDQLLQDWEQLNKY